MKKESIKIKLGIFLRSGSIVFASSLLYLVLRSVTENAIYGNIEVSEFLKNYQHGKSIVKWFIGFGSVFTISFQIYNWIFPAKKVVNYKIVIPGVFLFILIFEFFIFGSVKW